MDLFNFLFPKKCLECGKAGKYICENCLKKVPPSGWAKGDLKVYSLWQYEGVIRKAIIALKYKYATEIATELYGCIATWLDGHKQALPEKVALIPVPMHWYRKNFRGFNQTEEIGKLLAKKMGWKFIPDLVVRKKSTAPQTELSGPARRRNLKDVFAVNPNYESRVSSYESPIVFDDVFTTGSTLKEAAKVLKRGGCKAVWGLTIAR